MMKPLYLVLCLSVLPGPTRADGNGENVERLAGFQSIAFGEVKTAAVARLEDHGRKDFHGLKMTGDWIRVGASAQTTLAVLLKEPIDGWIRIHAGTKGDEVVELEPFCVPDYGYAVRLETDKGVRDFAICLKCGHVLAYGRKRPGVAFLLKSEALAKLNACYRDEFGPEPAGKP